MKKQSEGKGRGGNGILALREQNGITMITLAVTIILLTILSFTVVINLNPLGHEKRRAAFEADLKSLKEEVDQYYARYGELPVLKESNGKEKEYDRSSEDFNKIMDDKDWNVLNINDRVSNSADSGLSPYYIIDKDLLNLDLNYEDETFIVNSQSHTVYFPEGAVYAEGVDEEYNEDAVHYRIAEVFSEVSGNQADKVAPVIKRVDTTQTVRYLGISDVTSKSFKITAKAQDGESGLQKIVFHYKRADEATYRTIEYVLPRNRDDLSDDELQGTTAVVTAEVMCENLLTGENAEDYIGEFLVYIDVYDMAGNKSTLEYDPEQVLVPRVDRIDPASLSTEDWTNQNITVTIPVATQQFKTATGDNAYKKGFITQYKREGIDTEWQTYFNPETDSYDPENPPTIIVDRLTTIKYRYTDGLNGGPERTVEIDKIDKVPPTVDVNPETQEIEDSRSVTYGDTIAVKVQDLQDRAQWYGASGVSQWLINQSATTPDLTSGEWQDLEESQTRASTTSEGHIINIVTRGTQSTYKDVGTYYIWAKDQAQNINIQIAQIVISPRSVSDFEVEIEQNEYTYDGTPKTPGVTVKDGGVILQGCTEGEDTTGKDYIVTYRNNVEAGTATVVITGTGNYTGQADLATFIIKKATPTITVDPTSSEINFNDEKTFTATAKVEGAPAVAGTITAVSENTEKVEITGGASTPNVNATAEGGSTTVTYKGKEVTEDATVITVTFIPSDTRNYETAEATFTVTQVNKIANPITVTPNEITYNANPQNLVTTNHAEGEVYYSIGTPLTSENYAEAGTTTLPKETNAGEYEVYYYTPGNTNYVSAEGHVTVTIAPKALTVENFEYTPLTKPYDGTTTAPTNFTVNATEASGVVRGDTVNVTYETATYNDANVENANKITVTGIAIDNPNYTINTTTCEKEATITPLPITGTVTITGDNTFGSELTAHVNDDLNPADVTLSYQWFSNDSNSTTGGTPLTEPSANNTYTIGEGLVGKYIYVVVTATKENYSDYEMKDITDTAENRTDTVAPKKITPPTPEDKIYNGLEQTSFEGTADYDVTGNKGTNAGNYEGTAGLKDKENTVWADSNNSSDKTLSWIIEPKEIEVVWGETTTWTYDGEEHAPTAGNIEGVNGETIIISVTGGQTNVGNYTATATIANVTKENGDPGTTTNYKIKEDTKTKEFSITNADITGSVTITGTNVCGETLTAETTTTPADGVTLSYQWYVSNTEGTEGGTLIPGATNQTYTLTDDEEGKHIYVVVTAEKDNYNPATFKDDTDATENVSATVFKVTVTLNPNGGEVTPTSIEVSYNSPYGTLPTPTRTGYSFDGWYTEETNGTKVENTTVVATTQSHTLYAHWTANDYTVTLNPTGGSVEPTSKTVTYDSAYGELPTPEKTGYTFKGWYTEETDGEKIENSTTVTTASDHTLYAHWEANDYTIHYYNNGAEIGTSNHTYNVEQNLKTITELGATETGYEFAGWATTGDTTNVTYTDGQPVNNLSTTAGGTVNLYAVWQRQAKFHSGSEGEVTQVTQYKNGATCRVEPPTPIEIDTWTAQYWRADAKEVHYPLGEPITANVGPDFYAVYMRNVDLEYHDKFATDILVTFDAGEGIVNKNNKLVAYNSPYGELPTPTREGFAFGGWYTGENGTGTEVTNQTLVTQNTDHTLHAKWTIGVNYYNNGQLVDTTAYTGGSESRLKTAQELGITQDGYTNFYGWATSDNSIERAYTDGQATNELVTTDGTINLYAIWNRTTNFYSGKNGEVEQKVQYKNNGASRVEPPTPKTIDEWEAQYWRTENKEQQYALAEPITDNVGPNFYAVYARDINLEYHDHFSADVLITFDAGEGTVDKPNKLVAYNSVYGELPTPTRPGYAFAGWYTEENGEGTQVKADTTVTNNADHTLYAKWVVGVNYYNNGTLISSTVYTNGTESRLATAQELGITQDGYTEFYGWAILDGSIERKYTDGQNINELLANGGTIDLYAIWSRTANFYSGTNKELEQKTQYKNNMTCSVETPTPKGVDGWDARYWRTDNKEEHYALGEPITDNVGPNFYAVYARDISLIYNDHFDADILVTFDAGEGHVDTADTLVAYNSPYGKLPIPTRPGYVFGGWYTEEDGAGTEVTAQTPVTNSEDHTLYAKWEIAVNYYNDNELITSKVYTSGTGGTLETIEGLEAQEAGYTNFEGWATTSNTTEKTYTDGQEIDEITTTDGAVNLYAVWSRDANFYSGENKTLQTVKQYKNNGTCSVEAPTPIEIDTWDAIYWRAEGSTAQYSTTGTITDDVGPNFYAVYARNVDLEYNNQYEVGVTVNFNAEGGELDKASKLVAYNGTYGELPTPTKAGFTFGGWYTGENGTGSQVTSQTTVTESEEHTLYAKWVTVVNYFNGSTLVKTIEMVEGATSNLTTVEALEMNENGYTDFYGWATTNGAFERTYTDGQDISSVVGTEGAINLYAIWARNANFYSGENNTLETVTQYKNGENCTVQAPTPVEMEGWLPQYWVAEELDIHYPLGEPITDNVGPNFYAVYKRKITLDYHNH